ncbi:tyrosine-type recombinase/integrase [Desulfobacula sp.]|uniref:tyrosine-type recombinase/integrase n=1 Tax=Desulfobacula sp. TaxID=2593537 RepID=UPI002714623E|nr:tyrosine-type recombinase/integrase [Desulfobacula sp.]
MLHRYINQFVEYCQLANFSVRSIQALAIRLKEFETFLKSLRIQSVKKITYLRLIDFVADYKGPSIHVRKSRVWTLRQFYHFLTLHRIVAENIATGIPYPKIEKTVPQFLTINEYNRLIRYFSNEAQDLLGLRNFVIILMLGTLGLRTSTLIAINIEDIDLTCGRIWIREKGRRRRNLVLPHSLCKIIHKYLQLRQRKKGPFLISKRKKRISQRTLQDIFRTAADQNGIDKKLHARLFRHTAATHLNKVAGVEITQHVLGHSRRANTLKYAHLNPDQYAVYMKQHPFMQKEAL